MSYQRIDNFQTSLSVNEVQSMHKKIQSVVGELKTKRNLIHSNDYNNMISHLMYVDSIFNNWNKAKALESQNPRQACQYNPYQLDHTVVHQGDGTTTTILDMKDVAQSETWKSQFDQNVLNGPTYTFPPSSVWNIQKLKNINI